MVDQVINVVLRSENLIYILLCLVKPTIINKTSITMYKRDGLAKYRFDFTRISFPLNSIIKRLMYFYMCLCVWYDRFNSRIVVHTAKFAYMHLY